VADFEKLEIGEFIVVKKKDEGKLITIEDNLVYKET